MKNSMPRLLLVEDETQLSNALCQILAQNKYQVFAAEDGETGLDEALSGIYDLILLDIMLPKINGLEILRRVRKEGISTPVLLLTAKGEIQDKVRGLDAGADDYLAKPFSTEELLARVRALSRRKGELVLDDTLKFGDFQLELATYTLRCASNEVKLSARELELMKYLLLHSKGIAGREELTVKLWGYDNPTESNSLEVYISFLRKKLGFIGSNTKIFCIRNVGYQLQYTGKTEREQDGS